VILRTLLIASIVLLATWALLLVAAKRLPQASSGTWPGSCPHA
jgi:hypothetical protein